MIAGSTWYSNGTRTATATPGSVIRAYATGALQGVPYRLVLATAGGADVVAVLNPTTVFAGPIGLIGRVEGRVPAGVLAGTYTVCFRNLTGPPTATGVATLTVT